MKNRYYDRKVRESLEIDMAVVKYEQDKALNRGNGNFVRTNARKPMFKKWKHYIEIWRHFVLSDGLALYFHQFENGFNECGRNITFWIIKRFSTFSRLWRLIFTSRNYVCRDNGEITRNKNVKIIFLWLWSLRVKCRRILNFEKMNSARYAGKNDGFWLVWGIFTEYIKQNITTVVLRNIQLSFSCHSEIDKISIL